MIEDVHTKLFLSCDIVGSTAFKQKKDTEAWLPVFVGFYDRFPKLLAETIPPDHGLQFWKAIGDELVFAADVETESDIKEIVRGWLAAMQKYELHLSSQGPGLKTKGGAFLSTFPAPNRIVRVGSEDSQSDDYLGPTIDTGFRIMNSCSERYFTLSLEVAWAIALAYRTDQSSPDDLILMQTESLKGVWGGREYPLFAIDRHASDAINQALKSLQKDGSASTDDINALATACMEEEAWPSLMYLQNAKNDVLRQSSIADKLRDAKEKLESAIADSDSTGETTEDPSNLKTNLEKTEED